MPGLAALAIVAAGYDWWAIRGRHETISGGVRRLRRRPAGNAVWLAAVALAVDHFERRG